MWIIVLSAFATVHFRVLDVGRHQWRGRKWQETSQVARQRATDEYRMVCQQIHNLYVYVFSLDDSVDELVLAVASDGSVLIRQ